MGHGTGSILCEIAEPFPAWCIQMSRALRIFLSSNTFLLSQDDVQRPAGRISPQGLQYHSQGSGMTQLIYTWIARDRHKCSAHREENVVVNNSLVCQANKETRSTVKHQSEQRPDARAHPWRESCHWCCWGTPVYSCCHSLEHPHYWHSPKETYPLPKASLGRWRLTCTAPWSACFPIHGPSIQAQGYSFSEYETYGGVQTHPGVCKCERQQIISARLDVESVYDDYWGKAISHCLETASPGTVWKAALPTREPAWSAVVVRHGTIRIFDMEGETFKCRNGKSSVIFPHRIFESEYFSGSVRGVAYECDK